MTPTQQRWPGGPPRDPVFQCRPLNLVLFITHVFRSLEDERKCRKVAVACSKGTGRGAAKCERAFNRQHEIERTKRKNLQNPVEAVVVRLDEIRKERRAGRFFFAEYGARFREQCRFNL